MPCSSLTLLSPPVEADDQPSWTVSRTPGRRELVRLVPRFAGDLTADNSDSTSRRGLGQRRALPAKGQVSRLPWGKSGNSG